LSSGIRESFGRPMPILSLQKSVVPSFCAMDFMPLCPAEPPPNFRRLSPKGRSASSWITIIASGWILKNAAYD